MIRKGDHLAADELIKHIEDAYKVTFRDQMGSAGFFISEEKSIIAEVEVYWSYYLVWELEPYLIY